MSAKTEDLRRRRAAVLAGGGAKRVAAQHAKGKLTARERLGLLYEPGSFQELGRYVHHRCTAFGMEKKSLPGDGVVTGVGLVDGRAVHSASQDFTVAGGSVGEGTAQKITACMRAALETGTPFVFINDGAGARIQEGVHALDGFGRVFFRNVQLSGVVPQISVIAGPCAGGAAYSPALTDFIIQVEGAGQLYITGPKVIKEVTGEIVTAEELGGVGAHSHYSGVVHFVAKDDQDALTLTRRLLSFLPANNTEAPPVVAAHEATGVQPDPRFEGLLPVDPHEPYDVRSIIQRMVDDGDFLEVMEHFAANMVIGFGRILGETIGFVANQPSVRSGVLDIDSSDKSARFIRFCNAFNIPLVTLVDVPGFLPGVRQEYGGIIRHGAKMLFAWSACTVPTLTIILRKAYGGAYLAMNAKSIGADRVAAWPTAEVAVMGAAGAVNVLYRKQIRASEDPTAARRSFVAEYEERFANPYAAAEAGLVDAVIEPAQTRAWVAASLGFLRAKRSLRPRKKHGLIPL